jgi:hypothetical protein
MPVFLAIELIVADWSPLKHADVRRILIGAGRAACAAGGPVPDRPPARRLPGQVYRALPGPAGGNRQILPAQDSTARHRRQGVPGTLLLTTSGFWPRVRARALPAPVFLSSLTHKPGRCTSPRPSHLRCFLFIPPKLFINELFSRTKCFPLGDHRGFAI